jgi:tetratricopeptide (TPR) repeat protein
VSAATPRAAAPRSGAGSRGPAAALAAAALGAALLGGATAHADAPDEREPPIELRDTLPEELDALLERARLPLPPGFGSEPAAARAWRALESDRPVRARELTEQLLVESPASFEGHCLLGRVLHSPEGNLPRALHHLQRCRALFEERFGVEPTPDSPWFWHRLALIELYATSEELGRHEESLAYLDALEFYHPGELDAFRGWPLMSLGRLDRARAAARRAIERSDNAVQLAKAWTALCAVEGIAGDVEASYQACDAALRTGPNPEDMAVRLSNAAETARARLRWDESERLLLEATRHFTRSTIAAPWVDLLYLYLDQGRIAEARGALRELVLWHRRQPPAIDVHNRANAERAAAVFLLAAGYPLEATRLTARAMAQPDRDGEVSVSARQLEAASALLDRAACLAAAELRAEQAVLAPWREALRAWLDVARLRWRAWRSGRQVAALISSESQLVGQLRGHAASEVRTPEWVEADLVAILGPGVVAAAQQRARERLPDDGYADAYAAEVAWQRGRYAEALARADAALAHLPGAEVLLRARVAALGGESARRADRRARAAELFSLVLALDPGALRRARIALPVSIASVDDPAARELAALLRRSPRLRAGDSALRLEIRRAADGRLSACLLDAGGGVLSCGEADPLPREVARDQARRAAAQFHRVAFAPRVDLTQQDLDSLDGSTAVASARSQAGLQELLGELTAPGDGAGPLSP